MEWSRAEHERAGKEEGHGRQEETEIGGASEGIDRRKVRRRMLVGPGGCRPMSQGRSTVHTTAWGRPHSRLDLKNVRGGTRGMKLATMDLALFDAGSRSPLERDSRAAIPSSSRTRQSTKSEANSQVLVAFLFCEWGPWWGRTRQSSWAWRRKSDELMALEMVADLLVFDFHAEPGPLTASTRFWVRTKLVYMYMDSWSSRWMNSHQNTSEVFPRAEVEGARGDGPSSLEQLEVERVRLELARGYYVNGL
ncbi:hypothetical protein C8R46DRAFT_1200334 [Mycena filopes]|nr:hypothetical protein C8R46DRAFT_1200334 [Mycena filopes]